MRYNIYDDGLLLNGAPVSGLEYEAENLAPGAEYNFMVKALDSEGAESDASNVMEASTYMPNTLPLALSQKLMMTPLVKHQRMVIFLTLPRLV